MCEAAAFNYQEQLKVVLLWILPPHSPISTRKQDILRLVETRATAFKEKSVREAEATQSLRKADDLEEDGLLPSKKAIKQIRLDLHR